MLTLLLALVPIHSHAAALPNIKCGPNSQGEEYVWADTSSHQLWISKEDDLDTADALQTISWSQGHSKFSLEAKALLRAGGRSAVIDFQASANEDGGSMLVSVEGGDGDLEPIPCAGFGPR